MQKTKKNIGDKRTKECKGCMNTSEWVCFKCQQLKNKDKKNNDLEIRIIVDEDGNVCGVFTNLLEQFNVDVKIFDHRGKTNMEKLDFQIETISKYRMIYERKCE